MFETNTFRVSVLWGGGGLSFHDPLWSRNKSLYFTDLRGRRFKSLSSGGAHGNTKRRSSFYSIEQSAACRDVNGKNIWKNAVSFCRPKRLSTTFRGLRRRARTVWIARVRFNGLTGSRALSVHGGASIKYDRIADTSVAAAHRLDLEFIRARTGARTKGKQ